MSEEQATTGATNNTPPAVYSVLMEALSEAVIAGERPSLTLPLVLVSDALDAIEKGVISIAAKGRRIVELEAELAEVKQQVRDYDAQLQAAAEAQNECEMQRQALGSRLATARADAIWEVREKLQALPFFHSGLGLKRAILDLIDHEVER